MSPQPDLDPLVASLREQITASDERLLREVNTRLRLVAELREHKETLGLSFVDPQREAQLLDHLRHANAGPLSDAGVDRLFTFVLELVKREIADA